LQKDGIDILDLVRFVDYNIFETDFLKRRFFDEVGLVVCDADFEILRDESVHLDFYALVFCSGEEESIVGTRAPNSGALFSE
jgi:hypothetical protein